MSIPSEEPLLPAEPVPPDEFMARVVPRLIAEVELDEAERAVDLAVGVVLEGDAGGTWTMHFHEGRLDLLGERAEDAPITVIQSVADWRAALWEGRPPLVAEAVAVLRERGPEAIRPPPPPDGGPRPDPLKGITDLRGRVELVMEDPGAGDWRVGVLLGGGPIPPEPQATIRLGVAEAEAIRAGTLHPLEALITGQLQLDGDLGLILQLQAVAMSLSMATGGSGGR